MNLQNQFIKFNEKIKLSDSKLNELKSKKDIIINILKDNKDLPNFSPFLQGSYKMRTEVKPIEKDYDIDIGLRFDVNKFEYDDPLVLKKIIRDALKDHTEYGAEIKNPCVTVSYKKDNEPAYHVDIVTYVFEDKENKNSQLYLARGKEFGKPENKFWEKADPLVLIDKIENKIDDTNDKAQYKRVIRYLKRWKNISFSSDGNEEVPGIAITLLAYSYFENKSEFDCVDYQKKYDDFEALNNLVKKIKEQFVQIYVGGENKHKIYLKLPVEPYTDVFSKMTINQQENFYEKICKLSDSLIEVKNEKDLVEKCKKLNKILGDDFEVPEQEEYKEQSNFIPYSSASGKI